MIGPIKYGTLTNRTHLSERERRIWGAFMQQYPDFCEKIWYDVECGGMRGTTEGLKPEWEKNAQYLGRYKIDVVGENASTLFIFEVKGEASTKAMGELWLYDDLLKEEWNIRKPIRCICVSDEELPNVRPALEKEGYELIVVRPAQGGGEAPQVAQQNTDDKANDGTDKATPDKLIHERLPGGDAVS